MLQVFKKNDEGEHVPMAKMEVPSGIQGLHVNPNGKMIAVAAFNGTVCAWQGLDPYSTPRPLWVKSHLVCLCL